MNIVFWATAMRGHLEQGEGSTNQAGLSHALFVSFIVPVSLEWDYIKLYLGLSLSKNEIGFAIFG